MFNFLYNVKRMFSERLFILFLAIFIGFIVLAIRLFNLQILEGDEYYVQFKESIVREVPVTSARGYIYDKYGIPLASNKIVYNLRYDRNIQSQDVKLNDFLIDIIKILRKYDVEIIDELPISKDRPYKFLYNTEARITSWQTKDLGIKEEDVMLDAEQIMQTLKERFEIDYPDEPEYILRRLVALRYSLYLKRYYSYIPLDIASDINEKIVVEIEEKSDQFPGIYIEAEPVRHYEDGKVFSHILGYIGRINDTELAELKEHGYTNSDIVGKVGIEKEMEMYLRGVDGVKYVEVDNLGRRITSTNMSEPQNGNNIYLTIDSIFQKKVYDLLETQLNEIIINRINGRSAREAISISSVYIALAEGDSINLSSLIKATEGVEKTVGERLLANMEDTETYKDAFVRLVKAGKISSREMLLILVEQGRIVDPELKNAINRGNWSLSQIMITALRRRQINAEDLRLNPSTGSVVVLDVNTGKTIALVNYPSYDNNRLTGNFDQEYYTQLLNNTATPLVNRALAQRKAPGSVFKMITAIAALEEGIIDRYTTVYDRGIYYEAGGRGARCWIYPGSHGSVNVVRALEVSCNYFFYTVSYNMGRTENGGRIGIKAINTLNKYMEMFGLNEKSGIELSSMEYRPQMSGPEVKESQVLLYNPDAPESETRWYDGDTIRTAIGQAYNNYAPIHIAKYIATIATRGVRHTPFLINRIEIRETSEDIITEKKVEAVLDIKPLTWDIIQEGMYNVTRGGSGTATRIFSEIDIKVAGKTGTAQETNKPDIIWFGGYAPYDNPQIALSVLIPYSYDSGYGTNLAKDVVKAYFTIDYSSDLMYKDNMLVR